MWVDAKGHVAKNKRVNDVNSDISEGTGRIRSHLKVMGSTDCRRALLKAKVIWANEKKQNKKQASVH